MHRLATWAAVMVATAVSLWLIAASEIPLGVPGEWTWTRIASEIEGTPDWPLAVLAAVLYLGFVWIGVRRLADGSRAETVGWIVGLLVVGFGWLTMIQDTPVSPYRLSKAPWVLYYPASSGYFYEARYEMPGVAEFLAGYEEKMTEGDVLHVGTHPPGLFLFYRSLLHVCDASPALTSFLLQTQPHSVEEALDFLGESTRNTPKAITDIDRAVLWLAALITQFAVVATIVPLYLLLRQNHSRQASWLTVAFWPIVPAVALFLPKSDALFPLMGMSILLLWQAGWRGRSWWLCLSAGLLFWFGMNFSLALLPVGALCGALTLWEGWLCRADERPEAPLRQTLIAVAWGAAGFLGATLLCWLLADINLLNVWLWNYRNHAGFYDQYPRTYWKWLWVNPLEFVLAVGVPVFALAVLAYRRTWRAMIEKQREIGPYWACALVFGLLWISGKNMGEAARLWLFLMPWLIWLAAPALLCPTESDSPKNRSAGQANLSAGMLVLVLQLIVCVVTVIHVSGFHFGPG